MEKNYTVVTDGKPITYYVSSTGNCVDDALITDLDKSDQKRVLTWVKENFISQSKANKEYDSYKLKEAPESLLGIHLTHNQFKHAMLLAGFKPIHDNNHTWYFRISTKSPAIRFFRRF